MGVDGGIPELPPRVAALLEAVSLPEVLMVVLDEASDDLEGVEVSGRVCVRGGSWSKAEEVGAFHVQVNDFEKELQIGTLDMPFVRQGSGYGRTSVQRLADLGRRTGCRVMRLDANKVGRYAWARCGFAFETDQDREQVVSAAANLAEALGVGFDPDAVERPSDISDLAELVTRTQVEQAKLVFPFAADVASLGRVLLLMPDQASWHGAMTLIEDDPGYIRLCRYVLDRDLGETSRTPASP